MLSSIDWFIAVLVVVVAITLYHNEKVVPIRSGSSPIIRTYLVRISTIEQLLYSRTGNVRKSRQFEKIPVQQEFCSRFQNCFKLILNIVQILDDREHQFLQVPGAQLRDHSSTLRIRDTSLRKHRHPKLRGTKSSPTLFTFLLGFYSSSSVSSVP